MYNNNHITHAIGTSTKSTGFKIFVYITITCWTGIKILAMVLSTSDGEKPSILNPSSDLGGRVDFLFVLRLKSSSICCGGG